MALFDRIKEARIKKGFTQEQLGALIGVAKTTIAGYEKCHEPTAAKLGEIADVLGVDVNFLLQDEMKNHGIITASKESSTDEMKNSPAPAKAETGELAQDDLELLADYHKLNESGREAARNAVRGLTYAPNYQQLKERHSVEMADIADDAIRTIDKLTEMTRKNQNNLLRKK